MDRCSNTVSFLVYGKFALFTDPVTKTSGERHSYPVPTYEALRGILDNCYWKPTIRWVIDRVRIMNPMVKETIGRLLPQYHTTSSDRSYNTYLRDVAYQVEAHFEWANPGPGFEHDKDPNKHLKIANRYIQRGGRHDIFLGSRECQGYIEPCVFGEGEGAYDDQKCVYFGLMFHGYNYPEMTGRNALEARLWHAEMHNGIIMFPRPEDCPIVRHLRYMKPKKWVLKEDKEDIPPETKPHNLGKAKAYKKELPYQATGNYESWEAKLCETYDNLIAADLINKDKSGILPIGHIAQDAQVQIDIDREGNLIPGSAVVVSKENSKTILPCSIYSQFRTRAKVPHLLFDKLQYLAGDYTLFGGAANNHTYKLYIEQLGDWCQSEAVHPLVRSVFDYLKKGTLIQDLVQENIFPVEVDSRGAKNIPIIWEGQGQAPEIYSVCDKAKGPLDSTIRIRVCDESPHALWEESIVQESAIKYNDILRSRNIPPDICYVSGETLPPTRLHPYLSGTTKLISSGDTTGFTYRFGILDQPDQRVQISYQASQKIHLALRWLLHNQSITIGSQTFLIWSTSISSLPSIPSIFLDDINRGDETLSGNIDLTGKAYVDQVRKYIAGFTDKLELDEDVVLMALAYPSQGRVAITQYVPMQASSFLKNVQAWKEGCFGFLPVKGGFNIRTPSINEIALAAASRDDASIEYVKRAILNTIMLGKLLPKNIVQAIAKNTIRDMTHSDPNKNPLYDNGLNLSIAIIRWYFKERGEAFIVETDRSYRFGQVLAYIYRIERFAYYTNKQTPRITNAEKLLAQYCSTPAKTLFLLEKRLKPYERKIERTNLGRTLLNSYHTLIVNLTDEDLTNVPLNERFLVGYYTQLSVFQETTNRKKDDSENE